MRTARVTSTLCCCQLPYRYRSPAARQNVSTISVINGPRVILTGFRALKNYLTPYKSVQQDLFKLPILVALSTFSLRHFAFSPISPESLIWVASVLVYKELVHQFLHSVVGQLMEYTLSVLDYLKPLLYYHPLIWNKTLF